MTLTIETANMNFAMKNDRLYLNWLCQHNDVLILVECTNINVAQLLPEGWTCVQDLSTKAKAGVVFAWKISAGRYHGDRLRLGVPGYKNKMRARYIRTGHFTSFAERAVDVDHVYLIGHHFAPPYLKFLQPLSTQKIKRIVRNHPRSVLGADVNGVPRVVAQRLGLKYAAGVKPMLLGVGRLIKLKGVPVNSNWGKKHKATDHRSARRKVAS